MKKTILRLLITTAMLIGITANVYSQDWKSRIAEADSIEAIHDFYSKFSEFGKLNESSIEIDNQKLFLLWVKVEEAKHFQFFWAYVYDKPKWKLLIDHPDNFEMSKGDIFFSPFERAFVIIKSDLKVLKKYPIKR
jgi:hypothetical protein